MVDLATLISLRVLSRRLAGMGLGKSLMATSRFLLRSTNSQVSAAAPLPKCLMALWEACSQQCEVLSTSPAGAPFWQNIAEYI